MKRNAYILFSILLLSFVSKAQIKTNKDSSSAGSDKINYAKNEPSFILNDDSFRISPETFRIKINPLTINDPSTILMRTRMAIMNDDIPSGPESDQPSNFLHPYYEFYLQSQNVSLFRQVLGMAQLGAVGYIAYKHLKKYGLFH